MIQHLVRCEEVAESGVDVLWEDSVNQSVLVCVRFRLDWRDNLNDVVWLARKPLSRGSWPSFP